jgi:nicotinate-nucleotide pyrophosphorylase (carboxylating)
MKNYDHIIENALREDMPNGDISSAIFSDGDESSFRLIARENCVLCGMDIFRQVFELAGGGVIVEANAKDGDDTFEGEVVAAVSGRTKSVLSGERTALNFLGRMSGVATKTRSLVKLLAGTKIRLADTRKTTPGLRALEKYAVKLGGGVNHRMNLSDAIMLKDNHIAAAGGVKNAVEKIKEAASFMTKIEVEAESAAMASEAARAGADVVMLDNMSAEETAKAIAEIKKVSEQILIEVSGEVTAEKISSLKDFDIDIISSGAITHSAPCINFSLKV